MPSNKNITQQFLTSWKSVGQKIQTYKRDQNHANPIHNIKTSWNGI